MRVVQRRRPAAARDAGQQRQRRAPVRPPRAGGRRSCASSRSSSHHQAYHDPLTGLANRSLFIERVERGARRAPTATSPCCSSTSTTSRPSTTRSATPSATSCWSRSPTRLRALRAARATSSRASAATSSPSCSPDVDDAARTRRAVAERILAAFAAARRRPATSWSRVHLSVGIATSRRATRDARRADPRRRRRDVPGQGSRQGPLRASSSRSMRDAIAAPPRPQGGARSRRSSAARSSSSTSRSSRSPPADVVGRRGARALGAPGRGRVAPVGVHPARRGDRADRRRSARYVLRRGLPPGARWQAPGRRRHRACT